jgi:hypothetical protein
MERVKYVGDLKLVEKCCKNKTCNNKWFATEKSKAKYCSQVCSGEVDAFTGPVPESALKNGFVRYKSISDVDNEM